MPTRIKHGSIAWRERWAQRWEAWCPTVWDEPAANCSCSSASMKPRLKRIRDRFERQEFLALMVPAMLPPPTPFKLLVFSAGVFEMKPVAFLLAIISGRLVRFGVLSVLTVIFGPQIVAETKTLIKTHPSVLVLIGIGLILVCYLVYRLLRQPAKEIAKEIKHEDEVRQK